MNQHPVVPHRNARVLGFLIALKSRRPKHNIVGLPLARRLRNQLVGLLLTVETPGITRLLVLGGYSVGI